MSFRETEGFPGASAFLGFDFPLAEPKAVCDLPRGYLPGVKENIVELCWGPTTLEMEGSTSSQGGRVKTSPRQVTQAFNSRTQETVTGRSDLEASCVYRVSSRTAKTRQRNRVLK